MAGVRAVVRHAHDGPLFRVGTGGGVVDVTAHHSLLRADASPCKPLIDAVDQAGTTPDA